jgi:hypothetical protein
VDQRKQQAAERCIEIIEQRLPLTTGELQLLRLIINDIRLEFELEGAVHPSKLPGGDGNGPAEWLW